jgi:hypothetical protein
MATDKNELAEDIAHEEKMLHALQRRLRELELQAAQLGIDTRPATKTEIYDLSSEIERHKATLAQLRTEAAIDKESLVEVEYRKLLAEAWDTSECRPTVTGATRLQLERLRLGITPERAQEMEQQVRADLAEQAFYQSEINIRRLVDQAKHSSELIMRLMPVIGMAVRFDPSTALKVLLMLIPQGKERTLAVGNIPHRLFIENDVWHPDEIAIFKRFADDLQAALEARKSEHFLDNEPLGLIS